MSDEIEETNEPSLEEMLNPEVTPTKEEEPKPTDKKAEAAEPEKSEEAQPEEGDAKEKGDKTEEPPSSKDVSKEDKGLLAKAQDEKRKRQDGEKREKQLQIDLAAARAVNNAAEPSGKPKAGPKPIPDPLDDPDGFNAYNKDQTTANNQIQANDRLNEKFNKSEYDLKKELKKDGKNADEVVGEMLDSFFEICKSDPSLDQKSRAHPHPYEFMRDTVDKSKRHAEIDNLDQWREDEKVKMRAEVEAEAKAKADKLAGVKESIPETLGGESSAAGPKGSVTDDTKPLTSIITELGDYKHK